MKGGVGEVIVGCFYDVVIDLIVSSVFIVVWGCWAVIVCLFGTGCGCGGLVMWSAVVKVFHAHELGVSDAAIVEWGVTWAWLSCWCRWEWCRVGRWGSIGLLSTCFVVYVVVFDSIVVASNLDV